MSNTTRRAFTRSVSALCTAAVFSMLGVGAGAGASALYAQAAGGPSMVILVRHAEKAAEPAGDPPLSAAGAERAKALLEGLRNAQPSAIIVSPTKRTTETAAPLAANFGITPQVVPLTGGGPAHVAAVADAVRSKQGVVVVVGHSNTIPAIIQALGGPALRDLCDASYANLFMLHPAKDGKPAIVVSAQYGAPDVPMTTGSCAPMSPR